MNTPPGACVGSKDSIMDCEKLVGDMALTPYSSGCFHSRHGVIFGFGHLVLWVGQKAAWLQT
jgi:hypothetical protein